jgi:hypothetical protein
VDKTYLRTKRIGGQNVLSTNISATKRIGYKRIGDKLIVYRTYRLQMYRLQHISANIRIAYKHLLADKTNQLQNILVDKRIGSH